MLDHFYSRASKPPRHCNHFGAKIRAAKPEPGPPSTPEEAGKRAAKAVLAGGGSMGDAVAAHREAFDAHVALGAGPVAARMSAKEEEEKGADWDEQAEVAAAALAADEV